MLARTTKMGCPTVMMQMPSPSPPPVPLADESFDSSGDVSAPPNFVVELTIVIQPSPYRTQVPEPSKAAPPDSGLSNAAADTPVNDGKFHTTRLLRAECDFVTYHCSARPRSVAFTVVASVVVTCVPAVAITVAYYHDHSCPQNQIAGDR